MDVQQFGLLSRGQMNHIKCPRFCHCAKIWWMKRCVVAGLMLGVANGPLRVKCLIHHTKGVDPLMPRLEIKNWKPNDSSMSRSQAKPDEVGSLWGQKKKAIEPTSVEAGPRTLRRVKRRHCALGSIKAALVEYMLCD